MIVTLYKNLKRSHKVWLWVIAALVCCFNIVGALFEFTYIKNVVEVQRLRSTGVSVQGTVRDKRVIVDPEGSDRYFITYAFAASGRSVEREQQVKGETYRALGKNDSIEIRYLVNNPQISRVNGEFFPDFWEKTFLLIVFVLPLHCCAIWLPVSIARKMSLARRVIPFATGPDHAEQSTQQVSWAVDVGLGFLLLWILATAAGWIAGVGGGLAVGIAATEALIPERVPAGEQSGLSGLVGVALAFMVALPLTAIAVGIAQGLVLRRSVTWGGGWIAATVPAMLLGMVIAISVGESPLGDAILGIIVGVAQWLVLRRHLPRAGWWILASLGGAVLGRVLAPDQVEFSGVVVSGVIHIAIQISIPATIGAAITGTVLMWLFRQAASQETGWSDDRDAL